MTERKRIQFPISALCLLVAVVAVVLSLTLSTYRHNTQLMEMTRAQNAQLVEQTERFNAQMLKMTADHNAQLAKMAADHQKEISKLTGQSPVKDVESKR